MEPKQKSAGSFWLRETLGILFKLHPIILMSMGLLDANEAFFVLVVAYLVMGVMSLVKTTFVIGYDFVKIGLPGAPSIGGKIGQTISYLLGYAFLMVVCCFLLLIFFGLLYDAVERQDYSTSAFEGKEGRLLARTLLINGSWFLLMELIAFIRFVKNYRLSTHRLEPALFFGLDLRAREKRKLFPLIWMMLFFAIFVFMCTAFAFKVAILSFFIFDLGMVIDKRLSERNRVLAASGELTESKNG